MTINVGLVGYGLAGSVFHAPLITQTEGLSLKTIVTSREKQVQQAYPGVKVVPNLEELLEDREISLIVVATPNEQHFDYALRALQAGKHVIVDKPFVIASTQADTLITEANKQERLLSVYQNRRWDNDFLTIRQLLSTEALGEIVTCEIHYDRYRPLVQQRWREQKTPGSGTLYDLGAHLIDQALVLFGDPDYVQADLRIQRAGGLVDDYFHLLLSYPQHAVILHSGTLVRETGPRFQIHGTKGSFIKYGLDSQEPALKAGQRPGDPGWGADPREDYGQLTTSLGELVINARVPTLPGRYEAYYQGIVEAITEGKPLPVTAEEARKTIKVIEYAQQSSAERRAIAFEKA